MSPNKVVCVVIFATLIVQSSGRSTGSPICYASASQIAASQMKGPLNTGNGGFSISTPATITTSQATTVSITGASQFNGFLLYAFDDSGSHVGNFQSSTCVGSSCQILNSCQDLAGVSITVPSGSTLCHNSATPKGVYTYFLSIVMYLL